MNFYGHKLNMIKNNRLGILCILFMLWSLPAHSLNELGVFNDVKICVLLGYPGAGKGTLAQSLDPNQFTHLSLGDLLRDEVYKQSKIGNTIRNQLEMQDIDKIVLLSANIFYPMLEKRLLELATSKKSIILDGYPRTVEEAKELDKLFTRYGFKSIYVYLHTDVSVLKDHILNRLTCKKCHQIYNIKYNPPKRQGYCDKCKERLISRKTDSEVNINKRLEFLDNLIPPILRYYKDHAKLVELDGNLPLRDVLKQFAILLKSHGY